MNAETRAKEIVRELCKPLDGNRPYLETPHRKLMAEIIAKATTSAENDKLEEAAALLQDCDAELVRDLKSKDAP